MNTEQQLTLNYWLTIRSRVHVLRLCSLQITSASNANKHILLVSHIRACYELWWSNLHENFTHFPCFEYVLNTFDLNHLAFIGSTQHFNMLLETKTCKRSGSNVFFYKCTVCVGQNPKSSEAFDPCHNSQCFKSNPQIWNWTRITATFPTTTQTEAISIGMHKARYSKSYLVWALQALKI